MEVIMYMGETESFLAKDSKNRISRVTSRENATLFGTNEAEKFINNVIPKKKRKDLIVKTFKSKALFLKGIDDDLPEDTTLEISNLDLLNVKNNVSKDISTNANEKVSPNNVEIKGDDLKSILEKYENTPENIDIEKLEEEWLDFLQSSDKFIESIKHYKHELINELRTVEDQALDLRHSIEFGTYNVVIGYKLLMFYKRKLKYRRKLKNAIDLVNIICRDWFSKLETNNVYKSVENRKTKRYTPRALPELFNN